MLDIGTIAVLGVLIVTLTAVTMWIVSKRLIYPGMLALFDDKYTTAEGAIKRGYSALGTKSAQQKASRRFEGDAVEEILASYPEIMVVAEQISPELSQMIEDDPLNALRMAERYLPTLQKIFPDFFARFQEEGTQKTIYEF